MKHLYKGKTKDVYELDQDHVRLFFKDDMTGKDGVFDPGENQVGLQVQGAGQAALTLSKYYFDLLEEKGVKTHYVSANIDERTMDVKKAKTFGKGLEVICRFKAYGSFTRRYDLYVEEGQDLDAFVEVTLKDDERKDPPISKDALVQLGILTASEYDEIKEMTQAISTIVKEDLAKDGFDLYDIKLEFGRKEETDEILLIDEISGGNMRVFKGQEIIEPLELTKEITKK